MSHTAQAAYRQALSTGLAITRAFRSQGEYVTLQQMQVMFEVALKPGISLQELADRTDLSNASITRNIQALGEGQLKGLKPGLSLVETTVDPKESRALCVILTPKGKTFMDGVLSISVKEAGSWDYPTPREWRMKN